MTDEATLLADVFSHPGASAPYLAYADWLSRSEPQRAALMRVQVALAEAPTEALFAEEARLIDELGKVLPWVKAPTRIGWHRGFATQASIFPEIGEEPPKFARVAEWLASPSARFVRWLQLGSRPLPLPASVEHLKLGQCVLTEDVLALPRLRHLSVEELVDSVPLVHDGLEELELSCDLAILGALEGARLPALKRLRVHSLVQDIPLLERFAALAAALPMSEVELSFLTQWAGNASLTLGADVSRALAPLADRIVRLALSGDRSGRKTAFEWKGALPALRELELCFVPSADSLRAPAFETVTELSLGPAMWGEDLGAAIDSVVESGIGPRLRVLRIAAPRGVQNPLARLSPGRFEALEELACTTMGGISFEGAQADAFPRLERWQLYGSELAAFAASPFAERATSLVFEWCPNDFDWAPLRAKAPRLARIECCEASVRDYWSAALRTSLPASQLWKLRERVGDALVLGCDDSAPPPVAPPPDARPAARTVDPLLAGVWTFGRLLPYAARALAGPHWMPPALEAALPKIEAALDVRLDRERLRPLDAETLDEAEARWTKRYQDAIRRRFGEDASKVFAAAITAEPGHASLRGTGSRATLPAFLSTYDALPAPLREELRVVRGWVRAIARAETPSESPAPIVLARTADGLPRCLTSMRGFSAFTRALREPFASLEEIEAPRLPPPPPPPQPFDSVTRDHVVRRALHHWIGLVITDGPKDAAFKGDPTKGSYLWGDGESKTLAVAWDVDAVVAIAHDIHGDGEKEDLPASALLGLEKKEFAKVAAKLRPLVRVVDKLLGATPTCGLWVRGEARHRQPWDPRLLGNPILESLVRPGKFVASPFGRSNAAQDELAAALVDQVLAGGGTLADEALKVIAEPEPGRKRAPKDIRAILAALEKLGLESP